MNAPATATGATPRGLFTPGRVMVLVVAIGMMTYMLFPSVRRLLGIGDRGTWFLDSFAVLAANDAKRAGLDPLAFNPLDALNRSHVYSDWWFALGKMGFTREDNFLVGATWVVVALGMMMVLLRPVNLREAIQGALLILSPSVLLAVNRANNDLVIFALLAGAGLIWSGHGSWRLAVALGLMALATGLKYYPAAAAAAFLLVRPPSRLAVWLIVAGGVLMLTMANVWESLGRGLFPLPTTVHTFGAAVMLEGASPVIYGFVLVLSGGLVLALLVMSRKSPVPVAAEGAVLRERASFVLGAAVLVACFLAGKSYSYRLMFSLLLIPWLWREARQPTAPVRQILARVASVLVLITLWMDGLYCVPLNAFRFSFTPQQLESFLRTWHAITQPVVWLLMIMLLAALLEVAADAVQSAGGARKPAGR